MRARDHGCNLSSHEGGKLEVVKCTLPMMVHVQDIINSNWHHYEAITDTVDMDDHEADEAWATRNHEIREFYVLFDDLLTVGTASFQIIEGFAYIGYFYIRDGFHRQGYGR
ncbi:hypothetical protein GF325_07320, partial [Candidatus Bathyarchaeota archaeon]|nr:hypothetical protein [Candidatus Bathyarchaeota archaeon]